MADEPTPAATPRDLDLDLLVPDSRTLSLTVDGQRVSYAIPGLPTIPKMVELMRRERALLDAFAAEDPDLIETTAADAAVTVMGEIRLLNPDVPDIEMNVPQLLTAFRFIAGDNSVSDAVARGLSSSDAPARTHEEVEEAGETPLASTSSSPSGSSGSDGDDAGERSGGAESAGASSSQNSPALTAS